MVTLFNRLLDPVGGGLDLSAQPVVSRVCSIGFAVSACSLQIRVQVHTRPLVLACHGDAFE
jgi:hypothetical protein